METHIEEFKKYTIEICIQKVENNWMVYCTHKFITLPYAVIHTVHVYQYLMSGLAFSWIGNNRMVFLICNEIIIGNYNIK